MPTALFILGHAGSGKTKVSKKWVKARLKKNDPWVLLDKDICAEGLANALMLALGLPAGDRDSPGYKLNVRDLEYQGCLRLASEQLKLGFNVVMPGPWNKELSTGVLFDANALGFPEGTKLRHAFLTVPLVALKERIHSRESPRDQWKLANWDTYALSLVEPPAIGSRGVAKIEPGRLLEDPDMLLLKAIVK